MQNELWKQYSMYDIRKSERKELTRTYNRIGVCLLLFFILSLGLAFLFSFLLYIPGVKALFENKTAETAFTTVLSIICLGVPFLLLRSKKSNYMAPTVETIKPAATIKYVLLGLGACYVANFVSNFLVAFCESVGIILSQPDFTPPSDPFAAFIFFIEMTLGAGIFEELLFRGAVLGNLRRFGDKTAILVSAFLFAIFHGNLIQAPFAFVLGLYLGYIACKTDNILYPMLVHAINNGIAVVLTFLSTAMSEDLYFFVGIIYAAVSILAGIVGLVWELLSASKAPSLKEEAGILTLPQKFGHLFASPLIITLILICLFETLGYVALGSAAG